LSRDTAETTATKSKQYGRKNSEILVSIIIATRNEEKYIGKLLDSLVNQTCSKDLFEVIIVDGMSNDATLRVAKSFEDRLNLHILFNSQIRSTFAFNIGVNQAKGDLFVIVGAHSFLCNNFIEESLNTFNKVRKEEPMVAGVGGICINEHTNGTSQIIDLMYSSFFSGARSCRYKLKPHFSDSVIFGTFDKKIVISNGKFDEDFVGAGNDDELTVRLHSKGFRFFTNPTIVSHYFTRDSFWKFIKQTFNYGVAKGIIVRKGNYKLEFSNPASFWFIPLSFLIYEILLLFIYAYSGLSFLVFYIPILLYLIVSISVSFHLFVKRRTSICLVLVPMFFIFHNVLGLSSLLGLVFKKKAFF
jgi:dolichyl N-acetyl-alpha-D-glucosaminyl phosphate 3-beta-D-2,3-diacetamido-2,3-dideoxy-beta-D-glucuronosyltransferase